MSKNKDWKGNTQAVMATLNASNHSKDNRGENDYYATPSYATQALLDVEKFQNIIWEPACGEGHISNVLIKNGYSVLSTDLINRGYGEGGIDFLTKKTDLVNFDIITNPPFSFGQDFAEHGMELLNKGGKLAMLLRIQFLEGVSRFKMYKKYPPKRIYVFSRNIRCAKNGNFEKATGNASTYCRFVWEKGFIGSPEIKWLLVDRKNKYLY